MSTVPEVAIAGPEEGGAYAAFLASVFRHTYAHGYPADRLERHIAQHFTPVRQRAELADAARWTLRVADADRWVAFGMVHAGSERPACVVGARPAELERFYVDPSAHGTGLAVRLLHAVVARATAQGHGVLWLNVWRQNARAKRFYAREGFAHVGTHPFLFDGTPELDDVYALPLSAAISPRAVWPTAPAS